MKLTARQLRKIINEEIENHDYKMSKVNHDDILDEEFPEDVETIEDVWAGGANLYEPEDFVDNVKGIESLVVTENSLKRIIKNVINEMKWEPKGPLDRDWLNSIANGAEPEPEISPQLVRELGDWIVTNDELGYSMTPKDCVSSMIEALMDDPTWQFMNLEEYELEEALQFMIDNGVVVETAEGNVYVEDLSSVMRLASSINY